MYDILQLNDMLVPELKDIASKLGLKGYNKLNKQELIYKILDEQALREKNTSNKAVPVVDEGSAGSLGRKKPQMPAPPAVQQEETPASAAGKRPRKTVKVAPAEPAEPAKEPAPKTENPAQPAPQPQVKREHPRREQEPPRREQEMRREREGNPPMRRDEGSLGLLSYSAGRLRITG